MQDLLHPNDIQIIEMQHPHYIDLSQMPILCPILRIVVANVEGHGIDKLLSLKLAKAKGANAN